MENIFFIFGLAGLQILPIFTLIYLQNEIEILSNIMQTIPSKILAITSMILSFTLVFIHNLLIEQWIRILISLFLIPLLSLSINYTYKDYTIDEG